MSRWRAKDHYTKQLGSKYITAEGYRRLVTEQTDLWEKRRYVTEKVAEAAAEGDRSENAEYIYRKKQLREIDHRLGYLGKRLKDMNVVYDPPQDQSKVFFGAWVTVEHDNGEETEYRIVGSDELDASKNWISIDAPVAQALLNKTIDDEVVVLLPSHSLSGVRHNPKPQTLFITNIRYQ